MVGDMVLFSKEGRIGHVTFNRPEKLNAISEERGLKATLNWRDARFKDL